MCIRDSLRTTPGYVGPLYTSVTQRRRIVEVTAVKLELHDADTDTDTDILATILAGMSARKSVSLSVSGSAP